MRNELAYKLLCFSSLEEFIFSIVQIQKGSGCYVAADQVRNVLKSILYRANGSKHIGMGHLTRGLFLAEQLMAKYGVQTVFMVNDDISAIDFLARAGVHCIRVPHFDTVGEEIHFILEGNFKMEFQFSIVDVLDFDLNPDYLNAFRSITKLKKVISITDDSYKRELSADLIINGNPNQEIAFYKDFEKYLLGPSYFITQAPPSDSLEKVNSETKWLVTLGGSDHSNLLFKLLKCLDQFESLPKLLIATTSATGYLESLKKIVANNKERYEIVIDVKGLQDLWPQVEFAITAGGNTLFERIASGTPGLTLCQLRRQNEIADAFEKLGVNKNLGFGPEMPDEELIDKLNRAIFDEKGKEAQGKLCRLVVDGLGIERVCNELFMRGFIL